MTAARHVVASRGRQRLAADPSRVITRLFIPGQEGFEAHDSRAGSVVERILALDDAQVRAALDDVLERFGDRHRDLVVTFGRHAHELADRLDPGIELSEDRMLLMGATFTNEVSIEGAALCNPSMVAHPDQSDVPAGGLRFVMSVRGIGEGHRSSIGFRTGVIDGTGEVTVDGTAPVATSGTVIPTMLDAALFNSELHDGHVDEATDYVLQGLEARFTRAALDEQLERLHRHRATWAHASETIASMRSIADRAYAVEFASATEVSERVLWPATDAESVGMEDARFVRFVEDDGSVAYHASYTAYDGARISQQMLTTTDFRSFVSTPLVGDAAANKGMALFPRRIAGRFVALSRSDRESNSVAVSDDLSVWTTATPLQQPAEPWEILQLGNCGPPLETSAGWLVLTHGVGPMRTYRIGAILLRLEDPTQMIGRLRSPLLSPGIGEQDGYVPNVVYSCGALLHADTLVLPYGIGDAAIGFASVPLPRLLAALVG
ncbi:glycoside hydrolase family 130 protein [Mycolicibacterium neoaurum]|uniref:glycoside hydrolase family 130 protein n=1 Tax=Mycolicibacterium neoaurum TaxID=1795 RepID=UPI0004BE3E84|nr:glycoside hydrolase family 130 protein [Mycolicibacterium neoaurum]